MLDQNCLRFCVDASRLLLGLEEEHVPRWLERLPRALGDALESSRCLQGVQAALIFICRRVLLLCVATGVYTL